MISILKRYKFYFALIFAASVFSFNGSFDSDDQDYIDTQNLINTSGATVTFTDQTSTSVSGTTVTFLNPGTFQNNQPRTVNPITGALSLVDTFTINCPGAPNNGGSTGWAMFLNLIAGPSNGLFVTQMSTASTAAANASFSVEVFTRDGNALGGPVGSGPGSSPAGWTSLGSVPVTQGVTSNGISLVFNIPPILVVASDTVGVALKFTGAGPRYLGTGTPPLSVFSDANLSVVTGDGRSVPFTTGGTWFSSRALTGVVRYVLAGPPPPAIYSRCKNGLNIAIPDNNPAGVTDTFIVANVPAGKVITNMYFIVDTLIHTWVGDIVMTLTKGATTVFIMSRPGSGAAGSSGNDFIGTKFADTSRFSIDSILATAGATQNNPPYTGWFRCNKNANNTLAVMDSLSRFKGIDPNGTWTLTVSDNAGADLGTLRAYCLVIEYDSPTGISQTGTEVPNKYFINQNYPNPFNPTTNIKFGLPNAGNVKLVVFDVLGREVATLVNEFKTAGQYVVDFDASMYSSGVYFYRIESGNFVETKKMLLIK